MLSAGSWHAQSTFFFDVRWINIHLKWNTLKICLLSIFNLEVVLLFEKPNHPYSSLLPQIWPRSSYLFLIRGGMAQINQCDLTCRYISCFLPPHYRAFMSSGICPPEIIRPQKEAAGSPLLHISGQRWEALHESGPTASPLAFATSYYSACGLWFMHPIGGSPRNFSSALDN